MLLSKAVCLQTRHISEPYRGLPEDPRPHGLSGFPHAVLCQLVLARLTLRHLDRQGQSSIDLSRKAIYEVSYLSQ